MPGWRVVKAQKDRTLGEQRCWKAPFPSPIPHPKFQRETVPITELACTTQTPNTRLLWIHPSDRTALSQNYTAPSTGHQLWES